MYLGSTTKIRLGLQVSKSGGIKWTSNTLDVWIIKYFEDQKSIHLYFFFININNSLINK